jgi:hypothetical protein
MINILPYLLYSLPSYLGIGILISTETISSVSNSHLQYSYETDFDYGADFKITEP